MGLITNAAKVVELFLGPLVTNKASRLMDCRDVGAHRPFTNYPSWNPVQRAHLYRLTGTPTRNPFVL